MEVERINKELLEVTEQKHIIIEEIKRVRTEYEGDLRDKEKIFDQKIREIKLVVEDSEKRRKQEKERSSEAAREYKRVPLPPLRSSRTSRTPTNNEFVSFNLSLKPEKPTDHPFLQ